ncbi:37S ribosomal protein Mrp51p, mitochondrial [[Candida] anglica]|uniref:37S ribosomal protein Mrp51p, mitochondrial n=1 Tax=[Candida] anglica TaxID=148631 RepID=A0ABP0EMT6_9ASCO
MNNQELYKLFKNSKLAQVATPLKPKLRQNTHSPTHQIIYTPKSSAIRSNFGIKSYLPKKIGDSHIVFNDIDNKKNMPDVEKYSGAYYNRLKFQETGATVKNYFTETNPLFPSPSTKSNHTGLLSSENLLSALNLSDRATVSDVKRLIKSNPDMYKSFQTWLLNNNPQALTSSNPSLVLKNLREFLKSAPADKIAKYEISLMDFSRKLGKRSNHAPAADVQGTAGFSYMLKGRFNNTPNGVKYGAIVPGRMVNEREAAIGGFVAKSNDRTTILQSNYSKSYPGKHQRQFVMPFKITEAELTPKGGVRMYVDGVKVGSWLQKTGAEDTSLDRSNYQPSNPNFGSASERNGRDSIALRNLMNLISH